VTEHVRDEDTDLVRRATAGDADAVTELYRRHERRVYNLALRTLGNHWDAADVAQEASLTRYVRKQNIYTFSGG
jgi:RNA polymerase sigma-70 factor (ECF subfamily)